MEGMKAVTFTSENMSPILGLRISIETNLLQLGEVLVRAY
jgi:hypothetical protein